MGKEIILLKTKLSEFQLEYLRKNLPSKYILVEEPPNKCLSELQAKRVRIMIVHELTPEDIETYPEVEFVHIYGRGKDKICTTYLEEKGIYYTNNSEEEIAHSIAEYVLLQILFWERNMPLLQNMGISGNWTWAWRSGFYYKKLSEIKIGIVGNGAIGNKVGTFLSKAGLIVFYINVGSRAKKHDYEMIMNSDYISLHLELNAQTRHIIDNEFFHLMNSEAVLINTSRGEIVNEPHFLRALSDNSIRGASIDVTEHEPIHSEIDPIYHDKLIITPHISGRTKSALLNNVIEIIDNIKTEIWK